jgi:tellurium resistance protein TerD
MLRRGFDRKAITHAPALSLPPGQAASRPCRITSLEPASGHFAGGYRLVLRGSGFPSSGGEGRGGRAGGAGNKRSIATTMGDTTFVADDKRERILSLGEFARENPEEEEDYPNDWNDAAYDVAPAPPNLVVRFARTSDGHAVVTVATSVTPWAVECLVPNLSLFRGLPYISVSVAYAGTAQRQHGTFSASARRFKLLQEKPPIYPKSSSVGWHWQHVGGAKYCIGLFHDMKHSGTAIFDFPACSPDDDSGPDDGGLHYVLLQSLEREQKINLRLGSHLQLCADRRFERRKNADRAFEVMFRSSAMTAVRTYVNRLYELHLQIVRLSAEVGQLKEENTRLNMIKLPAAKFLLQGRQSLFVYLLEIMEEQVANDEVTIRDLMMQLLYLRQDKYQTSVCIEKIVTLTTHYEVWSSTRRWSSRTSHAAAWVLNAAGFVYTTKETAFRLWGQTLTKSQKSVAAKLYSSINASLQRIKEVKESMAWRKHMREHAGLKLTDNLTSNAVRIDAVEWSGFKDVRLKGDSSVISTVDVVSGNSSVGRGEEERHENGENRPRAVGKHPRSACPYTDSGGFEWLYSSMPLNLGDQGTVTVHWHFKDITGIGAQVAADVIFQQEAVYSGIKKETESDDGSCKGSDGGGDKVTSSFEKKTTTSLPFDIVYAKGVGALLFETEDHCSVVSSGWFDMHDVLRAHAKHVFFVQSDAASSSSSRPAARRKQEQERISPTDSVGGLHYTLHWALQRAKFENNRLRTQIRISEQEWTATEKLLARRLKDVYLKITVRTRAAFVSRLVAMEGTIATLMAQAQALKAENARMRLELFEKESTVSKMHVVFVRLLIWLKKRRENNARLIVRLRRDVTSACKFRFKKVGGKISTVRQLAMRGESIQGNYNPHISHPATWVPQSHNGDVKDFVPPAKQPLSEQDLYRAERMYNGSARVNKQRKEAKELLQRRAAAVVQGRAKPDERLPNVRVDSVWFKGLYTEKQPNWPFPDPQKKQWPKSRWTRKDGYWVYTQKSKISDWSPNRVEGYVYDGVRSSKRIRSDVRRTAHNRCNRVMDGRRFDEKECSRGFLDHPSPKDQRYYLVGPKRRPVPLGGATTQVLDPDIGLKLYTTTSAQDDRIKLEVEHSANGHPIMFAVDIDGSENLRRMRGKRMVIVEPFCKTRVALLAVRDSHVAHNLVAKYNWVVEPDQTHETLTNDSGMRITLIKTTSFRYKKAGGCVVLLSIEHAIPRKILFSFDIHGSVGLKLRGSSSLEKKTVTLLSGNRTDVALLEMEDPLATTNASLTASYEWGLDRRPEVTSEVLTNDAGMSLRIVKTVTYPEDWSCLISLSVEHELPRMVIFTTDIRGSENVHLHDEQPIEKRTVDVPSGEQVEVARIEVEDPMAVFRLAASYEWGLDRRPEVTSEVLTNDAGMSLTMVKTVSYPETYPEHGCLISLSVEHALSRNIIFTTSIRGSENLKLRDEQPFEEKTVDVPPGERTSVAIVEVQHSTAAYRLVTSYAWKFELKPEERTLALDQTLEMTKGSSANIPQSLSSTGASLCVGLGWDCPESVDIDASVIVLNAERTVQTTCYYSSRSHPDWGLQHKGDNTTGAGIGDDEVIQMDLSKAAHTGGDGTSLVVTVNLFSNGSFAESVRNAYVRIFMQVTGAQKELARYTLSDGSVGGRGLIFAELYCHPGARWQLTAVGKECGGHTATDAETVAAARGLR